MNPSKISGTVSSLDAEKRYGFVRIEDNPESVYFTCADVPGDVSRLQVGSVLKGVVVRAPKGPKLTQIEIVALQGTNPAVFYSILSISFVSLVAILLWWYLRESPFVCVFLALNVGAVFLIGLDKSLARSGSLRTPEVIFFVIALVGGSAGTLLGIHVFKHKSRRASFQFVLLLIVVAQLSVLRILNVDIRTLTEIVR